MEIINKILIAFVSSLFGFVISIIWKSNMNIEIRTIICLSIFFAVYFIADCLRVWKNYKKRPYIKLKKECDDKKIAEKFTKVCNWKRKYPDKGEYVKQHNDSKAYPEFLSIHYDRHDITEYYQDIEECLNNASITSNEFILLIPKNRAEILLTIIEPIEKEIEEITGSEGNFSLFRLIDDYINDFK